MRECVELGIKRVWMHRAFGDWECLERSGNGGGQRAGECVPGPLCLIPTRPTATPLGIHPMASGCDANCLGAECLSGRAVEGGIAEGEDSSVGSGQQVAAVGSGGSEAHDRGI